MILEELYLQNFCLYKGLHRFLLAPELNDGRVRPITLFGGMNGAGKTTILDAVQLALYGSRARTANRLGRSYEDYLRECIHRGLEPTEGASVSIKFRYQAEGQHHTYEVWRGWSLREKFIRERVRVTKDDVPDTFLSEHWNDVVEELIPIGVSQLFFFDAEKIRFLADEETDTVALGAAIKSLLGLDLAERLISDAAVVEKRLSDSVLGEASDEQIKKLQQDLESKSAELTITKAERAALENALLRAKRAMEKAKADFSAAGGEHWAKRTELQAELRATDTNIEAVEDELRELGTADLPLLLVPDLLLAVRRRDAEEQKAANAQAFHDILKDRDKKILKEVKTAKLTGKAIETLRKLLEQDRKARLPTAAASMVLDLSGQVRSTVERLSNGGIDDHLRALKKLLTRLKSLHAKKEKAHRLLNAVPEDAVIAGFVDHLKSCAETLGALEGNARRLDERVDLLRRERDELDRALAGVRQSLVAQTIEHEEALRMAALAKRTQATMREFLHQATAHKIERLSDLVTRSFQFLLRKGSLVARVHIHPETFKIDLFDDAGTPVPKGRLSEGEKQIFAIAVLWGLAQASPRQLPSIIDTPMARLDSEHRQHLVERYFPNASHQVIILSTDTEVERGYFEELRPRLARSYHLAYSDDGRFTQVEDGYFWSEAAEVVT